MTAKKEEPKKVDSEEMTPEEALVKANQILKDHGGNLSDVPLNSEYWHLMNEYRRLNR